jgi:DNA helicase-2/ATP-dependent DNA helicase PcrA
MAERPEARARYSKLTTDFVVREEGPSAEEWASIWAPLIAEIAQAISGNDAANDEAKAFLEWGPMAEQSGATGEQRQRDNVFRFPIGEPKAGIRLGSIHSVKGETHTATLVLDTYYYKHNLGQLKPWLLGLKSGKGTESKQNVSRLKQHYVAMTRPSHLLCLAMREDAFSSEELGHLKSSPWRVARVTEGGPVWL